MVDSGVTRRLVAGLLAAAVTFGCGSELEVTEPEAAAGTEPGEPRSDGPGRVATAQGRENADGEVATRDDADVASGRQLEGTPPAVDLVGDSLTLQAVMGGGLGLPAEPEDLEFTSNLGLAVGHVLPWVHDQVAAGRPDILVIALGTNDGNSGWTRQDVADWLEVMNAPAPETCVVVVLPAVGEGAAEHHRQRTEDARAAILALVDAREREGRVVVRDWADVIDADPLLLDHDGIHLAPDPTQHYGISTRAAEARLGLYWDGVADC